MQRLRRLKEEGNECTESDELEAIEVDVDSGDAKTVM